MQATLTDKDFEMGVEMKTLSLKASAEEEAKADAIVEFLTPFVATRSQALRLGLNILYALVTMKDTVGAVVETLQGILRHTEATKSTAYTPEIPKIPPVRMGDSASSPDELRAVRRRRVLAFSRLEATFHGHAVGTAHTPPSFPGRVSPWGTARRFA